MTTTDHGVPGGGTARALQELRRHLSGTLLQPGEAGYDDARRVWNGVVDAHPAAVARAGSIADIDRVLVAVQRTGLPLAVRGGGHGVAGHGTVEGGLVLDLGRLRDVVVDPANQLVSVQPGATVADLDRATARYGLAVPLGVVGRTGVAGLALGGGLGWLTRAGGLTLDNLDSADVVTAAGDTLHASEEENPELFWGLRGGGGNFGVVSSCTFRARRLPPLVLAGKLFYRRRHWRHALVALGRWAHGLPDEMTPVVTFTVLPAELDMGGEPWLVVGFAWASADHRAGLEVVDRLRTEAPPDVEEAGPTPWLAWQSALDGAFPRGSRGCWGNVPFSRLDDEVLDVLTGLAGGMDRPGTGIDVHLLEGAFGRVPEEATAFPNRSSRFWLSVHGVWHDPALDEPLTAYVRAVAARMQPFAEHGEYVGFLGPGPGDDPVRAAHRVYGREKHQRLTALKNRYDPDNLFRCTHNVPPTPG